MPSSYQTFRNTRTFSAFDGLRGLLSIVIVWCHSTGTLYEYGYLCLSTFFLISGFLITTLLLRERDKYGQISLKMFYARRTLRIFPLYYTIVAVYALAVYFVEKDPQRAADFRDNLPYFLTYTSNWFVNENPDVGMIFFFSWSLATEEQFYLVWPWVERYTRGHAPVLIALGLIGLDQVTSAGLLTSLISPNGLPHRIIYSISTPICIGVILAHVLHDPRGYRVVSSIVGWKWSSLTSLLIVLIGLQILDHKNPTQQFLEELCLLPFVAACVVREDHWLSVILGFKPATRLGVISYGTYLMHMLAINLVRKLTPGIDPHSPPIFFMAYPLAITCAAISYRYYEGYFLKLKTRFERIPKPSGALVAGEPLPDKPIAIGSNPSAQHASSGTST